MFELRFPIKDLLKWSNEYSYDSSIDENIIMFTYAPKIKMRGYIFKDEFLDVCRWKTQRSQSLCKKNNDSFVIETTRIALNTPNEEIAIKVLKLLEGVQYPTASVILHFFHSEKYPIIDFRALWSLKTRVPKTYTFDFWKKYVDYCRLLSKKSGLDMRTIDKALWAYSKKYQRTKKPSKN
jgi:hypothetical protein